MGASRNYVRKFHELCAKSFGGLAKYCLFEDSIMAGSGKTFVSAGEGNCFSIFLITSPRHVHMGLKIL